jgi:galactokinase
MSSPHPAPLSPPFLADEAFAETPEAVEEHAPPDADQLQQWARTLLRERMGPAERSAATAYACGTVGVQADQTHYSGGFGLFLPLRHGVAVAARPADRVRVAGVGTEEPWPKEESSPPPWVVVVRRVVQELMADRAVEVAVVSTVPDVCRDGALAALALAVIRVVRTLDVSTTLNLDRVESLRDDLMPLLAAEVGAAIDRPYSTGYLLATAAGSEPAFTLVDTTTREHLPVETEARTALRWAVVDPGEGEGRDAAFHRRRHEQAEDSLRILRENGFEGLEAFRDLEHRDLDTAAEALPEALRPVVRHLVTENRRVQKHVAAMRRSDWQMIGALLLMSHASQRDQWESTTAAADAVVAEAEARTHDGLYGACMTGRAGAVLVVGRPRGFGRELARLSEAVNATTGYTPRFLSP